MRNAVGCSDCGCEHDGKACWVYALDDSYMRCPECDRKWWRERLAGED